jgi:signal transduction histidine kinase
VIAVIAVVCAAIVTMETYGYAATPPSDRMGMGYTIAHTAVGISYAICAGIVWRVSESKAGPWVMLAVAFFWIPQPLYAAIGYLGGLWPPIVAIDLVWAIFAGVLVVLYPNGRIVHRTDRVLIYLAFIAAAVRAAAVLLVDRDGPSACLQACAPNIYAIFGDDAAYNVIEIAFRLFCVIILLILVARVLIRWVRSSPPARSAAFIMPIAVIAWAAAIIYQSLASVTGSPIGTLITYLSLVAVALIAVGFAAGVIFIYNLRGRVSDLMVVTSGDADRGRWQASLAATLRDPWLRVFWWDDLTGGYVDSDGASAVPAPTNTPLRHGSLLKIESQDGPLAVVDHDTVLSENGQLLDAVSSALRLTVDNDRLRQELEATLQEVRQSRVRIIEAAIAARTRIERDLHDGSQQALVSLALSLRMASTRARAEGAAEVADDIDRSAGQLAEALKGLRELARGIHPTSLTVGGLATALPELAMNCALPVALELEVTERLSALSESTIYFVVAEALTNAVKYSATKRCRVRVLMSGDELIAEVTDDGRGGAVVGGGSGLRGLVDRVEAIGGHLTVRSTPGDGTRVTAIIPSELVLD